MIRYFATAAVFCSCLVASAHADIAAAPGPDIESGVLGVSLLGGAIYLINRRRKRA